MLEHMDSDYAPSFASSSHQLYVKTPYSITQLDKSVLLWCVVYPFINGGATYLFEFSLLISSPFIISSRNLF